MPSQMNFPTEAFIEAAKYKAEQESKPTGLDYLAQGVGEGISKGVTQGIESSQKKQQWFMELMKTHMITDEQGQPIPLKDALKDAVYFSKNNNLPDNHFLVPIKQPGMTYIGGDFSYQPKLTPDQQIDLAGKKAGAVAEAQQQVKQKYFKPEDNPSDDELKTLAQADINGLGAPNFGLGANVNRQRYQKIKAQTITEMGGAISAAGQRTQVMAGRSAAMQGAKTQDTKVNLGIDLQQALSQNYDPKTDKFNIPSSLYTDLALGYARMLAPGGQVGVELVNEIKQGSGQEALSKVLTYAGFSPEDVGGTTQGIANFFAKSIVRQGQVSEQLRNKYTGGNIGSSFNQSLQNSNLAPKLGGNIPMINPSQPQNRQSSAIPQQSPQIPMQGQGQPQPTNNQPQGQPSGQSGAINPAHQELHRQLGGTTPPPAGQFKGQQKKNQKTGAVIQWDGQKWIPMNG